MIHVGRLGGLPARRPQAAANLEEPMAERPRRWMRLAAQELDHSLIDDGSWRYPSVLPITVAPEAYFEPHSHILLQQRKFEATLPQMITEGLGVLFVRN